MPRKPSILAQLKANKLRDIAAAINAPKSRLISIAADLGAIEPAKARQLERLIERLERLQSRIVRKP